VSIFFRALGAVSLAAYAGTSTDPPAIAAAAAAPVTRAGAMEDEIFRSATRGLSRLFSLNLFSKLLTFTFNTAIIRRMPPEAKGLERSFEAVVLMALFLQREAARTALQRQKPLTRDPVHDPKQRLAQLIMLGWAMVPWGVLCTAFASVLHMYNTSGEQYEAVGSLHGPLALYAAAVVLETAAEPAYLLTQNLLLYDVRVVLEGAALLFKTVFTYVALRFFLPTDVSVVSTLVVFGVAQCLHSAVLLVGYNGYFLVFRPGAREVGTLVDGPAKLLPHRVRGCPWIDFERFQATYELWVESLFRCVLQEGEKWVLMICVALGEQGAYTVVANLGALVARMVFKFVEDVALAAWSKLLGEGRPSIAAIQKSARFFALLAKGMVLTGVVFLVFGIPYCEALLYILYSDKWLSTAAPRLLQWYCVYVACMGVSGISEAFVRAVADSDALNRFKSFQLVCGLSYLALLYGLSTHLALGSTGVILANILSMTARALYSFAFVLRYFRDHNAEQHCGLLTAVSFSRASWAVLLGAAAVIHLSARAFPLRPAGVVRLSALVPYVAIGVVCFGAYCAVLARADREFLRQLRRLWRSESLD